MHTLASGTGEMTGNWDEANMGLPEYSVDDSTRLSQHVLAVDDERNPDALYLGGEGISFSKAIDGLSAATGPAWKDSQKGLTNLLMARMPILFTGLCDMRIAREYNAITERDTFTVYIEDSNGNPPLGGSTFKVWKNADTKDLLVDITYPDAYTHEGTKRDPSNIITHRPYVITAAFEDEDKLSFEFIPFSSDSAPGTSGTKQLRKFEKLGD